MKHLHHTDHDLSQRAEIPKKGQYNIKDEGYLVDAKDIIIPALHLELGAMTQLVTTLANGIQTCEKSKGAFVFNIFRTKNQGKGLFRYFYRTRNTKSFE